MIKPDVIKSYKVSYKYMCAYFPCELVAWMNKRNDGIIDFTIPLLKSNKRKMFPGVYTWTYDFFRKIPKAYIDGISCYKVDLERLIRKES